VSFCWDRLDVHTIGAARICEVLSGDRDELPSIAGWMKCQFQHSPGAVIAYLAIGEDGRKGIQA